MPDPMTATLRLVFVIVLRLMLVVAVAECLMAKRRTGKEVAWPNFLGAQLTDSRVSTDGTEWRSSSDRSPLLSEPAFLRFISNPYQ